MGPALVLSTDMAREGQVAVAGRFLAYLDDYVPGQERAVGMAGDAFLVALYIGGSACLTMDGLTYELERNNLVACSWEQFRRAKCDAGCRFRCISLSSESARDLAMLAAYALVRFYFGRLGRNNYGFLSRNFKFDPLCSEKTGNQ